MGRVLTVTYVFLLLGIQPFVNIPAEREVQPVSADVEQTEEIRPKIALTFDDGPSAAYTEKLLDGLRERDVHATFFLIGENIEKGDNALLVRQMARDGHLIGNHTYHHVQLTKIKEDPGYVDSGSAGLVCKRYRENCQQSSDAGKRK